MAGKKNWTRERDEWIQAVRDLCDSIRKWCEARKWFVHEEEKTLYERQIGTYELPVLFLHGPGIQIQVDPIGRDICRADGRVDLVAFPSLNRMTLYRIKGEWRIMTDYGDDWPQPWGRNTFFKLAKEIVSPA